MRITRLFLLPLLLQSSFPVLAGQDETIPEGIMASRGEGSVTRQMFDAKISRIPARDRAGVLRSAERVKKILADLVLNSQLVADATADGFDQGDVRFRMQLAAETELATAWLNHYVETQPDADYNTMAREYYQLNLNQFETAPSRDVTHLLVSSEERPLEEAKQLAQSFLDQINSDPTVFNELVIKHSEDPSVRSNKGHFTRVKRGDMVKAFEESTFSLQNPGDFSGLVESGFGIHIIRLDKVNPVRTLDFEEVREKLESSQLKKHKDRIRYDYLNQLGTMEAHISEKEIRAMVNRYFDEDQIQDQSETSKSE